MIEDIKPPEPKLPTTNNRQPMRGQRLVGHSADGAKQRLSEPNASPNLSVPIEGTIENVPNQPNPKKPFFTKKKIILLVGLFLLISLSASATYYFVFKPEPKTEPAKKVTAVKKTEPAKPTTVASPLTGTQISPELAKRPVTAIMIENSPDARPQSALRDAGIIFEAIAEGGITRFATLFLESQPAYIGPVRSLRPYYIDWIDPFDASVAHVGGSRDALDIIRSPGHKDLDQFFNAGSYWRISERYAPHNVYTSFEKLNALNSAKGFNSSTFTPWSRKNESKLPTPTAKSIDFNVSGFYYNVHYDYDPVTNSYLRSQAGKPHVDVTSQKDPAPRQLSPKVVIALVMPFSTVKANDGWRTAYGTTGSGQMYVFQDGNVTSGTWSKTDSKSQFAFKDSAGAEIKLNPGQTWVTVVDNPADVKYVP